MWEEARVPGENPHGHGENMQTPRRNVLTWESTQDHLPMWGNTANHCAYDCPLLRKIFSSHDFYHFDNNHHAVHTKHVIHPIKSSLWAKLKDVNKYLSSHCSLVLWGIEISCQGSASQVCLRSYWSRPAPLACCASYGMHDKAESQGCQLKSSITTKH